ncbi:MAG: alpha/beta fold hydrolase [Burkholderiales bacterium]|nr:MAG: alpha/beta fold hydrolase [Burkholderiales bacterium]
MATGEIRLGSMVAECCGSGPPVVMIHGLGGTSNAFQPVMAALQGYRVLRPDLPGAGRSAYRVGANSLQGLVRSVQDLMRAAGIGQAHLVGHSMGTLIAQWLAATDPRKVLGLTLFGPILEPAPAARQALLERAAQARSEGMAALAAAISDASLSRHSHAANPLAAAFVRESLMRQDPKGYAAHCEALAGARAAKHAAIAVPTLLVAGADDSVAPVAIARSLRDRVAGARLEIVENAGHWMTIEAPQRAAELLRQHLEAVSRQR